MAKFCPLFSSSSGNSIYIGCGENGVLIDAGVSAKRTDEALYNIGVDPDAISAIFVTHEHSDHIGGLKVFAAKHNIKVLALEKTLEFLEENTFQGKSIDTSPIDENGYDANGIFVKPFRTSHDAIESCGYVVETPDGRKISVATDLGIMTSTVHNAISGSDLVLLESNHDIRMLENSTKYPYPLKKRILGEKGHLSNDSCADEAVKLLESGTTRLVLGHLSKENNFPELAYQTTYASLTCAGAKEDSDYILKVAKPVWDSKAVML